MKKIDWERVLSSLLGLLWQLVLFTVLFAIIRAVGRKLIDRGFTTYAAHSHLSATRVATMHTLSLNAFSYTVIFFYLYAVLTVLGVPVGTLLAGAAWWASLGARRARLRQRRGHRLFHHS
ncbi:hypothetical protein [Lacticaseibacillus nasuensis]|uniref:hypothetical protein n=1 Tax=Lacticaseibacillus nasuensis TaxID=944671 RepID=UPI001CDA822F|nr:hypothetical protein [Lacticaseibacillus nasuensis]